MKKQLYTFLGIAALTALIIAGCKAKVETENKPADTAASKEELVKRGEYLVAIAGCDDCHSPKVFGPEGPSIDMQKRLSGHPQDAELPPVNKDAMKNWVLFGMQNTTAAGPWGISFAANITSDESGIGNWTEEQFIKAMREGKYKGLDNSRPLLPPMPWQSYKNMTDEDLKAVFAYLMTTKPVKNIVPAPVAPPDMK
ncbi:MAG: c-type cytochrome [Ignavibacteriaceae bacterium]|nr:c-type cytochrome [Ignavibacteriaceae bacterium]NUM71156.1 c-type cytochrome [Ignavibacteriaceae bacterium]